MTQQTYEDGDTVSYQYDNSGALASITDSATGCTTTYYYDFTDRLMKYVEEGTNYSHSVGYEYDTINNLTKLVETINGVEHTTSYEYDLDNRVTSVTNGDTTKTYSYDGYSRVDELVTKHGSTTVLTTGYTYRNPTATTTTGQISQLVLDAAGFDVTYSYTYDDNGNILSVSDGTNTTSYVYDTAGQLLRENNQAAGKTWTWTYDSAGNIQSCKEYNYTVDSLDGVTPTDTVAYTYGDTNWGDLLTAYDGQAITYDEIGNPVSDGTWTYTWEHGRQLASMTDGTTTWSYEYNADGLRTKRTNGTTTYEYIYNGSSLVQMTVGNDTLYFAYDSSSPMTVTYNGVVYYYVTNLQGDVIAILDALGTNAVEYSYDAWGNILTTSGTMAETLGAANPLTYRGYVYDRETGLYYLQSRYYDPQIGRFINVDALVSTGQEMLGNNMFSYCCNNPINGYDPCGTCMHYWYLLGLVDCEKCKGKTIGEKWKEYREDGLTATFTTGGYVSANLGVFNISGSLELALDLKGNIQIVGTVSFDVTTAGSFSASGGLSRSAYIMPDTSYLAGDTYYAGGGVFIPVTPSAAVGGGGNVGQTSDGYWGVMGTLGVGTITASGGEFHGGYAKTGALSEQFNVIDWVTSLVS